eukprot:TRINITY_DN301_c8_g1_i1.p1 TRINITY_DN301_c8_g1~~TRINITY_DN301_c8_g1_i1.p1  ORF type:complete len:276 (+),score=76.75 TRINITY_DN301_c8_g1_i1:96-830(+)
MTNMSLVSQASHQVSVQQQQQQQIPQQFHEEALPFLAGGICSTPPPVPAPSSSAGSSFDGSYQQSSQVVVFRHDPYSWTTETVVERRSSVQSNISPLVSPKGSAPQESRRVLFNIKGDDPTQRLGAWIRGNAITNIVADSPADKAGLVVGMRIHEVDYEAVDCAVVSNTVRRNWKVDASITLLVELPVSGERSKRSLAKARARQRMKAARAAAISELKEYRMALRMKAITSDEEDEEISSSSSQ